MLFVSEGPQLPVLYNVWLRFCVETWIRGTNQMTDWQDKQLNDDISEEHSI